MKHKQTLAMLLAAAMVLSMPLGAYAQGTAEEENPTDLVQPYVVDTEAPTVSKISIDKTNLKAGETAKVTIEASDDVSQLETFYAQFKREGSEDDYIDTNFSDRDTPSVAELEISPYLPSGTYVLDSIFVSDNAGNSRRYRAEPIEGDSEKLPNSISITINNENQEDTTAPTISKISIDKTNLKAGETAKVTIEASDDVSQLETFYAQFKREGSEDDYIDTNFSDRDTPSVAELEISPYLPSGTYVLDSIFVSDKAGNRRRYEAEPDEGYTEELPNSLKITVINDDPVIPPTEPEQPTQTTSHPVPAVLATTLPTAPTLPVSSTTSRKSRTLLTSRR